MLQFNADNFSITEETIQKITQVAFTTSRDGMGTTIYNIQAVADLTPAEAEDARVANSVWANKGKKVTGLDESYLVEFNDLLKFNRAFMYVPGGITISAQRYLKAKAFTYDPNFMQETAMVFIEWNDINKIFKLSAQGSSILGPYQLWTKA